MKMLRNRLMLIAAGAMLLSATATLASEPKYVFFFLGDGMANAQIQATEAYLTTLNGGSASLATAVSIPGCRIPPQCRMRSTDRIPTFRWRR